MRAARKQLEWSVKADQDVIAILRYYGEHAPPSIVDQVVKALHSAATRLTTRDSIYRTGPHHTRECIMRRFPFIIVYRSTSTRVNIVRVLHQARSYFNR